MRTRIAAAFLISLFSFASLSAQSLQDKMHWAGLAGLFYFAADNGVDADPPPILPSLGFSAGWQFMKFLRLELTEDIYITNYEYNAALGYPMACSPENRSAMVVGLVTGIQLTGAIPIGDKGILLRAYGGPAADIRIVLLAAGLNHPADFSGDINNDAQLQTDAIRNYFWSKARWFMPTAGFGMDFPLTEKLLLGFDLRAWFPIYKIWANDSAPALDGWRFGAGLRITPRKKSGNSQQASQQAAAQD